MSVSNAVIDISQGTFRL